MARICKTCGDTIKPKVNFMKKGDCRYCMWEKEWEKASKVMKQIEKEEKNGTG